MPATQERKYYVCVLTNRVRTLYVGVTNDLHSGVGLSPRAGDWIPAFAGMTVWGIGRLFS